MDSFSSLRLLLLPLAEFLESTPGHLLITLIVPLLAAVTNWAMRKRFAKALEKASEEEASAISVRFGRNVALVYLLTGLLIVGIWSSRITGMLISLAAIGGAILVVSKEPLQNMWGRLIFSLNSNVALGDHIEIGDHSGRLLSNSLFNMQIAQIKAGKQTGRIVTVPNHLLITEPLINLSNLGRYCVHTIEFRLTASPQVHKARDILLEQANKLCESWLASAKAEFEKIRKTEFMHLPRPEPEVIWGSTGKDEVTLTVRLACPTARRGQVEQHLLKEFYQKFYAGV